MFVRRQWVRENFQLSTSLRWLALFSTIALVDSKYHQYSDGVKKLMKSKERITCIAWSSHHTHKTCIIQTHKTHWTHQRCVFRHTHHPLLFFFSPLLQPFSLSLSHLLFFHTVLNTTIKKSTNHWSTTPSHTKHIYIYILKKPTNKFINYHPTTINIYIYKPTSSKNSNHHQP